MKAADKDGADHVVEADSVIYALGLHSNMEAYNSLIFATPQVIPVGDCLQSVKAKKTREAMLEGYWATIRL